VISTEYPLVKDKRDEVNLVSLVQVAWRYNLLIATVAVVFALVAVYVALTTRPVFRSEVVLTEVSNDGLSGAEALGSRLGGLASLAGVSLGGSSQSREAVAVLRSRYLAEEFIKRYGLVPKLLARSPRQSLWLAVDRFRRTVLSITESKEQGTITVGMQWRDPAESARWANDFVALANDILRTRALEDSSRNIRYLKEQIPKTDVVEIQRAMYNLIENETKINMLANTRKEYAFSVVDPAVVPEERIWPRRTLIVLTGGFLGGIIGMFIALAHNMSKRHAIHVRERMS
jgi:uncharacterized protein involved in exopolysaccharide biosynthesis